MNQDEALKQAQHEIWNKGTFFQSEMAQYAIQLGFEKGAEWKEEQMIERIKEFFSNCPRYLYLDKDVLGNNFLNRELMLEDLLRELKGE